MAKIKSLSDQVCDYVLHLIRTDQLSVGDKIEENMLIDKLGISRTPIREALIQLSSDGLLDNVPRKGFFVKTHDQAELREMFVVIGTLDACAAQLALPQIDEREIKRLSEAVERIELAINKMDHTMYYEWQEAFHMVYWEKCGNKFLQKTINDLLKKSIHPSYYSKDEEELFATLSRVNSEHKAILRAFQEKNIHALRNLILTHWTKAESVMAD